MYNEEDYGTAGQIMAYGLNDITFTHPLILNKRCISATDFSIATDGTGQNAKPIHGEVIPIHKYDGARISEQQDTGTEGHTCKVTVEFEVFHPTNGDYDTLRQLRRNPHHLILSHMGDRRSIIRATEDGWHYEEEGGDMLKVKLTIHNVSGQQRILE